MILRVFLALLVLWSAAWLGVSLVMRHAVTTWFDQRGAEGWQAEFADLATSGYPLRVRTRIDGPALADPDAGTAWSADWIALQTRSLWPGTQDLSFPDTPQRLSHFDRTIALSADNMVASLDLRPRGSLELRHLGLTSEAWRLDGAGGMISQADALRAEMTQGDTPEDYAITLVADGFQPGGDALPDTDALPDRFDSLQLQMRVRFDRPWDRRALDERRPQPRQIQLDRAEAIWGPMLVLTAGRVDVDPDGIPTGSITIKAENWRDMLALAETTGSLSPDGAAAAERVLSLMAGLGGNPDALDVTLGLRAGNIMLGPIPIGPAPRIILR
ncbi:MAG: DUF2125 domain-containing protein [Marinibacterium sp.]|nr:DUF2125 domain-containing protein [Marinibacterium sp.]